MSIASRERALALMREAFPEGTSTPSSSLRVQARSFVAELRPPDRSSDSGGITICLKIDNAPPCAVMVMHRKAAIVGSGLPVVELEDEAFSKDHRVRGLPPDLVRQLLEPSLRAELQTHLTSGSDIEIYNGEARHTAPSKGLDADHLRQLVDLLAHMAERLVSLHEARLRAAGPNAQTLETQMREAIANVEAKRTRGAYVVLVGVLLFVGALVAGMVLLLR